MKNNQAFRRYSNDKTILVQSSTICFSNTTNKLFPSLRINKTKGLIDENKLI